MQKSITYELNEMHPSLGRVRGEIKIYELPIDLAIIGMGSIDTLLVQHSSRTVPDNVGHIDYDRISGLGEYKGRLKARFLVDEFLMDHEVLTDPRNINNWRRNQKFYILIELAYEKFREIVERQKFKEVPIHTLN